MNNFSKVCKTGNTLTETYRKSHLSGNGHTMGYTLIELMRFRKLTSSAELDDYLNQPEEDNEGMEL